MFRVTLWAILISTPGAFAASVIVNGNCQVGNCASPDVVATGGAISTAFNFTVTLPNTDRYQIAGSVNSSAAGASLSVVSPFMVIYEGNSGGTSSANDTITLDVLQNFHLGFTLRESTESAQGAFSGAFGAGSNVQIQLIINGQALPVMGPFTPPANFSFKSASINITSTSAPLFDVHHVFTFAAGSAVGATIYNALTPGSSSGGSGDQSGPAVCDSSSSDSPGCTVIACDGGGGTLPIYRPALPKTVARTSAAPGYSSCSLVASEGSGGTLPILYPTGPSGTGGSPVLVYAGGCGDAVCENGSGGTLPILYPTGPTGGSGPGVIIAEGGAGSSLPIDRPARARPMRSRETPVGSACSLVAEDGAGGTLPILYPSGPSGSSGSSGVLVYQGSCTDAVCETGRGGTLPILYPTGPTGGSGAGVIVAETGAGGSLPIDRPARHRPMRARETPVGSACSLVAFDGGGSTLPVLYPSGPSGSSGSSGVLVYQGSCTDAVCENGSGSTLPILYPTGPTGGSGPGVIVAEDGGGSDLPIDRPARDASAQSTAAPTSFPIEIATPFESTAATYTVSASCSDPTINCWVTVPIGSGAIAASSRTAITAVVDSQNLAPGTYTANVAIAIAPQGQPASIVNVPVTLALAPTGPYLMLSQSGLQFQAAAGAGVPAQTVTLTNAGTGALSFTATASTASGNWLSVSPASGTITTAPAQVSIQANPAGLAPGVYSGLVQFSGSGIANGTQSLEVSLTVAANGAAPSLTSNALVFVANQGANPAPQMVQLFNPGAQTLTASASVGFVEGSGWFTASSSADTVSAGQPLTEMIAVDSSSMAAGVYLGSLDIHLAEIDADELVEVVLIVKQASCTPTRLVPVITNLGGGFEVTAGMPVPLLAQVVDDCGASLTSGAVMAYFPGGDLGVPLTSQGQGQWSGTWLPHAIAQPGPATVALLASANTPALYGSAGVLGAMVANPLAPVVFSGGAVSSASLAEAPLAPGSRVSIFGANLAGTPAVNNTSPYPLMLGGTQVLLGGEPLPLQVVDGGLINAIVPYDLPVGVPQQLIVQQGGQLAIPETVVLAEAQPAVFTQNESGQGAGAVLVYKPDGTEFENDAAHPASTGDVLAIYCSGLGEVSPAVPEGVAAPPALVDTVDTVSVTIGGVAAQVSYAGLAPELVGAYQINVTVPAGIAPGSSVPLIVSESGAMSPPVTVAIQ